MDLSSLGPGAIVVDEELAVSQEAAKAYLLAVGDAETLYREHQVAPPMAIAALAMAAAMRAVELPPGAVHTGQELTFVRPVTPTTRLRCSARVGQNSVRRGTRFLTLQFQVAGDGHSAVEGQASIAIPEEGSA